AVSDERTHAGADLSPADRIVRVAEALADDGADEQRRRGDLQRRQDEDVRAAVLEGLPTRERQRQRGEDVLQRLHALHALDEAGVDGKAFDERDSYMAARTAASRSAYARPAISIR